MIGAESVFITTRLACVQSIADASLGEGTLSTGDKLHDSTVQVQVRIGYCNSAGVQKAAEADSDIPLLTREHTKA